MKFRPINQKEHGVMKKLNWEFGIDVDEILEGRDILVSCNGRTEVFVTNPKTADTLKKMKKDPYCVGLYIGEIKKDRFFLSLEGATLIKGFTKKKVFVTRKAEQLVLYKRDVLSKSVIKYACDIKTDEKCLIVNEDDEVLAIGIKRRDFIGNIIDRGWYLRKGE